jgi:hypothetical protein
MEPIRKTADRNWREEGRKAWKACKRRVIPTELHGSLNIEAAKEWYRGWDEENIEH